MSLRAGRPETCLSCVADPASAPGRYCAANRCLCGHEACPAFASYRPRAEPFAYLAVLHPQTDGETP